MRQTLRTIWTLKPAMAMAAWLLVMLLATLPASAASRNEDGDQDTKEEVTKEVTVKEEPAADVADYDVAELESKEVEVETTDVERTLAEIEVAEVTDKDYLIPEFEVERFVPEHEMERHEIAHNDLDEVVQDAREQLLAEIETHEKFTEHSTEAAVYVDALKQAAQQLGVDLAVVN